MTTITVGTRVTGLSDEKAADLKAKLIEAAKSVLGSELADGSILSESVGTDLDTGEKVKKSKLDFLSYAPAEDGDDLY